MSRLVAAVIQASDDIPAPEINERISKEPYGHPMTQAFMAALTVCEIMQDQHGFPREVGMELVGAFTAGSRLAEFVLGVVPNDGDNIDALSGGERNRSVIEARELAVELLRIPVMDAVNWIPRNQVTWFVLAIADGICARHRDVDGDGLEIPTLRAFVAGYARVARGVK